MPRLSVRYLEECFAYDPEDGSLVWRERPVSHFPTTGSWAAWNTSHAGKLAGRINKAGYREVNIGRSYFGVHRIAWALSHGRWPSNQIDHIDQNPANNRLANLRDVTVSENARNRRLNPLNTSGVNGVTWQPSCNKWQVTIAARYVGVFDTLAEATTARKAAECGLGYSDIHGRPSSADRAEPSKSPLSMEAAAALLGYPGAHR